MHSWIEMMFVVGLLLYLAIRNGKIKEYYVTMIKNIDGPCATLIITLAILLISMIIILEILSLSPSGYLSVGSYLLLKQVMHLSSVSVIAVLLGYQLLRITMTFWEWGIMAFIFALVVGPFDIASKLDSVTSFEASGVKLSFENIKKELSSTTVIEEAPVFASLSAKIALLKFPERMEEEKKYVGMDTDKKIENALDDVENFAKKYIQPPIQCLVQQEINGYNPKRTQNIIIQLSDALRYLINSEGSDASTEKFNSYIADVWKAIYEYSSPPSCSEKNGHFMQPNLNVGELKIIHNDTHGFYNLLLSYLDASTGNLAGAFQSIATSTKKNGGNFQRFWSGYLSQELGKKEHNQELLLLSVNDFKAVRGIMAKRKKWAGEGNAERKKLLESIEQRDRLALNNEGYSFVLALTLKRADDPNKITAWHDDIRNVTQDIIEQTKQLSLHTSEERFAMMDTVGMLTFLQASWHRSQSKMPNDKYQQMVITSWNYLSQLEKNVIEQKEQRKYSSSKNSNESGFNPYSDFLVSKLSLPFTEKSENFIMDHIHLVKKAVEKM